MKYFNIIKKFIYINGILFFVYVGERASAVGPSTVNLDNPLGETDIYKIIGGKIIQPALGLIGSLALLMFVYGGFLWLTSGGSPDKIKKGRDVFMWAGIGILIIMSSYILVKFILDALAGKL